MPTGRTPRATRTWRYSWNAYDQLTEVVTPDGTVWTYTYDPFGRRLSKQRLGENGEAADQTLFTWHDSILVEETTGTVTLTWNHEDLHPVAQTRTIRGQEEIDQSFYAIVTDLIGAPTHLFDETGEVVWRMRSSVWGVATAVAGTEQMPLRFPGQYADEETGWYYNCHRHYDPAVARYSSPDPLGLVPAPNPYSYPHNPQTWADPLGLAPRGPKDPLNLGGGYTGRLDQWSEGTRGIDFEIHVYDKRGKEVGLFGSNGFFNKHGLSAKDAGVPDNVMNALKGKAVDFMRSTGRLGPKGTQDITGDKWMRPRLGSCPGS